MPSITDFNLRYNFILNLIEDGNLEAAYKEYLKLIELQEKLKKNETYFKLRKLHKSLSTYSLIKKAYELK